MEYAVTTIQKLTKIFEIIPKVRDFFDFFWSILNEYFNQNEYFEFFIFFL